MPSPTSHDPSLSQFTTELSKAAIVGPSARGVGVNRCQAVQSLTSMTTAMPTLMLPAVGYKQIRLGDQSYHIAPGEVLTLPSGLRFDMENIPDTRGHGFLAASLIFDHETVALFQTLYGAEIEGQRLTPRWKAKGSEAMFRMISEWIAYDRSFPADATQTRHRLVEILLLLAREGVAGHLLLSAQANLRERVRHLLALDPARDWRIGDLTDRLAMSESTLRRRLREDGAGFRDILEEARLDRGVEMVMMGDMPISQVAFECGYQSQSRFSERFRLRFSMSPTELRATQRADTTSVVAFDRQRSASRPKRARC